MRPPRYVFFDWETHLIKPGQLVPRGVCLSFAERAEDDGLGEPERVLGLHRPEAFPEGLFAIHRDVSTTTGKNRGTFATGLLLRKDASRWLRPLLEDSRTIIVGHNVTYDLGIGIDADPALLRLVFQKYADGLVHDTIVRQQLIDICTGEMKFHVDEDDNPKRTAYDLSALSLRLLDKRLAKKDTWRLKYALLDGVPLSEWPAEAIDYAVSDAVTTGEVHEKQTELVGDDGKIPNSEEQHCAAWGLHLQSVWGIRTDGEAVEKLAAELEEDYAAKMLELKTPPTEALTDPEALPWSLMFSIRPSRALKSGPRKGLIVPEKVSKNMKAIRARVVAAYAKKGVPEEEIPKTDGGGVSTAKKTLVESGDELLKKLAEVGAVAKLLETYVPILRSGTEVPINPRYNVLVETGRTSCAKPNIQNPPRGGGVRACFVARPGHVYAFSDYDTLELRALAQVCLDVLGKSEMAEALRRGEDLHLSLAAEMLGISLEETQRRFNEGDAEVREYRQQAKPANFGFPGGMAAASFREYAEGYGIKLTEEQSEQIHDTWFRKWPEMRDYFEWIKQLVQTGEPAVQIRSGRMRGGASFCATANGFFQGLAADGAKEAVWRVAWECYVDESSPLFGCRPVFFIHDEIGMEIPFDQFGIERSARAAQRLSDVMIEAMKKWIPNIPISCKPVMVRRWYKGAEPVRNADGFLVPCKPVKTEKDGKKKTTWVADV